MLTAAFMRSRQPAQLAMQVTESGKWAGEEPNVMRKEWFISAFAIVPAFLASQHHNLMMLLMATGLSGAETTSMTAVPLARRAMLLLSLAMLIVLGYQIRVFRTSQICPYHGLHFNRRHRHHGRMVRYAVRRMTRDAMQEAFRKDLTHLTWDEVYARQVKRASLVGEWMDALHLKSGDRLLEIGAGPGYVSLMLADRVGPAGTVYAVDRSADALAYLQRLQKERGVSNIERLVAERRNFGAGGRSRAFGAGHNGSASCRRPSRHHSQRRSSASS